MVQLLANLKMYPFQPHGTELKFLTLILLKMMGNVNEIFYENVGQICY